MKKICAEQKAGGEHAACTISELGERTARNMEAEQRQVIRDEKQ